MKVKDLIEELSQYSPDMEVVTSGYEGGCKNISSVRKTQIILNVNSEWWYGPHEELNEYTEEQIKDHAITYAIYLT